MEAGSRLEFQVRTLFLNLSFSLVENDENLFWIYQNGKSFYRLKAFQVFREKT